MSDIITLKRRHSMLLTAMGPVIAEALTDKTVIEVMANPDGSLWLDKHGEGRSLHGTIDPAHAERIIRLVASHIGVDCTAKSPIVSGELPETGERFEGLIPPVVLAPTFAIRKPADVIYTLEDYVKSDIMTSEQASYLRRAIAERKNILVVGGTSSGKTTLTNALLTEVSKHHHRIILIEDTRELQCNILDLVALRTKPGVATLSDLVRSTLRLRPDRIIIGEVRGREALDMLKAWNTGHAGGITTLHANSAKAGLFRLEQLVQEAVSVVPRQLIAEAIDVILFIEGRNGSRRVRTIAEVTGLKGEGYQIVPPSNLPT